MQSSFLTAKYIGFFISKSVFQCELHLILNSSFNTYYSFIKFKTSILSCWYTLERLILALFYCFSVQQSGLPSLDRCEIVLR
jgi:hypothetical protein